MAEILTLCHFCEISQDVTRKCETCDVLLCDLCLSKVHSKIKNSHEHAIHDLGDSVTDVKEIQKVELRNIPCSSHTDKNCFTFCRHCEKSLCSSCVISSHQYEELNQIFERKLQGLDGLQEQVHLTLPFFVENAEKFRQMEFEGTSAFNEIIEKICEKKSALEDCIRKEANMLKDDLRLIWNPDNNPVIEEKERLCKIEDDLKQRNKTLQEVLQEKLPSSIFPVSEQISKEIPNETSLQIKVPRFQYLESSNTESHFGTIIKVPELSLIQTFEIDLPDIAAIASPREDKSVIYSATQNYFKYFTISGSKIITTQGVSIGDKKELSGYDVQNYVISMAFFKTDILLSDIIFGMNIMLHQISPKFSTKTYFKQFTSFDKIVPCGICVGANEVYFGYRNEINSTTGIMVLDSRGSATRKYEFSTNNEHNTKLFTLPGKIARNINDDICIIDYLNVNADSIRFSSNMRSYVLVSRKGRVVTLGKWGQPKWTYTGHPTVNEEIEFSPYDIVTTSLGLILVAERDTSAIHVLSKDGHFITNCALNKVIVHPVSLNINHNGQLLIGCSDDHPVQLFGKGKASKLHIANIVC